MKLTKDERQELKILKRYCLAADGKPFDYAELKDLTRLAELLDKQKSPAERTLKDKLQTPSGFWSGLKSRILSYAKKISGR